MQKKKLPAELNKRAKAVVDALTSGEAVDPVEAYKKEFARSGGLVGGKARAKKLTAEQRSEIARKAARARWRK